MAKPFYRLQRFLRRTQMLFLFLGVAYIMAGSVLLLQRSVLMVSQRGSLLPPPSLPSPPRTLKTPALRPGYGMMAPRLSGHQVSQSEDGAEAQWLITRNQEIRHLRRRWFHSLMSEQDTSRVERVSPKRKVRHKGTYIGCFLDDAKDRVLKGMVFYDFRKMTSTLCQDTCTESGYQYAGVEYGSECYCGNRITGAQLKEEDCNLDCKGEKGSICGGVGRLSIYKVEEVLLGQRRYRNVRYRGCFKRPDNITAASLVRVVQPNLTSQMCIAACMDKEFPLAMLSTPDCFCGYATPYFSLHEPVNEDRCAQVNSSMPTAKPCPSFLQVYQTPVQDSRCTERRFLPEKSSQLVALSSFPGAGNTWVRHLIELATGYYTGSYYFDGTLYNKGFKGEKDYWKSGRTICVKTHESGRRDIEMYDSAILLIRNPYHSLMAEFNRKCAGHLGYASDQHWKSKEWPEFVGSYASWWVSHVLDWLRFGQKLLVVQYEDLQKSLVPRLHDIITFLNASTSEEHLLCAENNKDGHFKRSGVRRPNFDPFTPDMRRLIDSYITVVDRELRTRNYTGLPQEYLPR
ncbi:sialate:O-sulfotransferase 1 [Trichomycterus rosablanca]|uniref:sialate:O-sulfotransferase 1 n=1 Tax=Trichomycterus rosablanca TaxID=2290929 RepID=UPI002F3571B6